MHVCVYVKCCVCGGAGTFSVGDRLHCTLVELELAMERILRSGRADDLTDRRIHENVVEQEKVSALGFSTTKLHQWSLTNEISTGLDKVLRNHNHSVTQYHTRMQTTVVVAGAMDIRVPFR